MPLTNRAHAINPAKQPLANSRQKLVVVVCDLRNVATMAFPDSLAQLPTGQCMRFPGHKHC